MKRRESYHLQVQVSHGRSLRVDAVRGPYQIIRRLPAADDGEFQHEIRSAVEAYNRVARESKLTRHG